MMIVNSRVDSILVVSVCSWKVMDLAEEGEEEEEGEGEAVVGRGVGVGIEGAVVAAAAGAEVVAEEGTEEVAVVPAAAAAAAAAKKIKDVVGTVAGKGERTIATGVGMGIVAGAVVAAETEKEMIRTTSALGKKKRVWQWMLTIVRFRRLLLLLRLLLLPMLMLLLLPPRREPLAPQGKKADREEEEGKGEQAAL